MQRNARERVALIVRPDPDAPNAAPTDNLIYALFHRVVFAVDARDGSVKWGHLHDSDVAGAEAVRGGLVLVDDAGHVSMLDAQLGHQRWRANVATRPLQGILGLPIDFAPGTDGAETPTTPADTLLATAGGTDTRMLPARVFATKALAAMPGADATRALLDIASRRATRPSFARPQEKRSRRAPRASTRSSTRSTRTSTGSAARPRRRLASSRRPSRARETPAASRRSCVTSTTPRRPRRIFLASLKRCASSTILRPSPRCSISCASTTRTTEWFRRSTGPTRSTIAR